MDLSVLTDLAGLAPAATEWITASSASDDDGSGFALLFLLAGPVFYGVMFMRYRNTNKRHHHESETRAAMHDVRATDHFHRSLKGVSHRRMKGANNGAVRGARRGLPQGLGLHLE